MNTFGELLREFRKARRVTMGQLAAHLEVSIPYISDVERGNRGPLVPEKLEKAAKFLGIDSRDFWEAAARERGSFELNAGEAHSRKNEVGIALMREWSTLDEKTLEEIQKLLEQKR